MSPLRKAVHKLCGGLEYLDKAAHLCHRQAIEQIIAGSVSHLPMPVVVLSAARARDLSTDRRPIKIETGRVQR